MSARSKARRRWRRMARFADAPQKPTCKCNWLCALSSLVKIEGGAAYCPRCGHVIGRRAVAALHARRALSSGEAAP